MTSEAIAADYSTEHSEQDKERLILSISWLIQLRWYAIGILGVLTMLSLAFFGPPGAERPLFAVGGIVLIVAACNFSYMRKIDTLQTKAYGDVRNEALGQVVVDICAVTLLVHYSGGIENPLILVTALPLVVASHLLPRRHCNFLAISALLLMVGVSVLEVTGPLDHVTLSFARQAGLWHNAGYIGVVMISLAFLFFAVIRFSTALVAESNGERGRSAELAQALGERMLAIEAALETERIKRAKLDEGLSLQWKSAEAEKTQLAATVREIEEGVVAKIGILAREVKEFESTRSTMAVELEQEISQLRENLENLEPGAEDALTGSTGLLEPKSRPAPPEEAEVEEETEEPEETGEEEEWEEEEDEGEEDDKEEEAEEEEGYEEDEEEFDEPEDPVSEALLCAIREVEGAPEAESVLMDIVLSDDLPEVMADPELLEQLFTGILMRSLEMMPDGGRVSISTSLESGSVVVEIDDTSELEAGTNLERTLTAEKKIAQKLKASLLAEARGENGARYVLSIPV